MIVFDLSCEDGHRFEGWFGSSGDFASQLARGLLTCPECGSAAVTKAPMAPAVPLKGNQVRRMADRQPAEAIQNEGTKNGIAVAAPAPNLPIPADVMKAVKKLAEVQSKALKDSQWVGKDFAEKSRAMHYGEEKTETIHGEATPEQAQDLLDEGVSVAPLLFPVAPPEDVN